MKSNDEQKQISCPLRAYSAEGETNINQIITHKCVSAVALNNAMKTHGQELEGSLQGVMLERKSNKAYRY